MTVRCTTRRSGLVTALLVVAACVVPEHGHAATNAPVVKAPVAKLPTGAPDAPCDFAHRMDIAIVNGVWFECSCEALMVGTVCDWYEITSAAPGADLRKKTRRITRIRGGWLYTPRVRPVLV